MVKMENNPAFSLKKLFIALLIWGFLPSTPGAAVDLPLYELTVSFDLKRNLVKGLSTITLRDETVVSVGDLKVMSVTLNDKPLDHEIKEGHFKSPKGTLRVTYEGIFGEGDEVDVVSRGLINAEGISLTGMWYPQIEGLAFYKLAAVVPEGFIAVSEAEEITVQGMEYSFHFPHPLQAINLAAGRYTEIKESFNATEYLEMYEDLIGPYPYKRFSVVENILPTGFSMPTYTLLGRRVVRLPFIVETSLGHEVLHQWFGNFVYGDLEKGNWLEAITTYLADHLYEEQKRIGWDYRKKILIDYLSYVNPANEIALEDFTRRRDSASRAIGYGKGAMVFHMLKNLVGEDVFYTSLRELVEEKKFQLASWADIRGAFEKASGKDLGWFFTQWLTRKGVVSFEIEDTLVLFVKGVPTVFFSVVQPDEPFRFDLPVRIITEEGEVSELLNIKMDTEFFDIPLDGTPLEMVELQKKSSRPLLQDLWGMKNGL
jgi:aminopeptidase N